MFSREIIAAELPECRIEIVEVDHVAGGVADLDAITDAIRLAHEDVDPTDETGDWSLKCKSEYQRNQAKRNDRGVPVLKEDRQHKERNHQPDDEPRNTFQVVLVNRILNAPNEINIKRAHHHEANDNHCDCEDQLQHQRVRCGKTGQAAEQLMRSAENDEQKQVRPDDKLIARSRYRAFVLFDRLGLIQGALHVSVLLDLVYFLLQFRFVRCAHFTSFKPSMTMRATVGMISRSFA